MVSAMRKRLIILLAAVSVWSAGFGQFKPVDAGSAIKFTIQNFGFDVSGSFSGLHGTINFDPKNPADAHFDVYIDAATVNTNNSFRDSHLRDECYFDIRKYPRIRFISTGISINNNGVLIISGKLTIKNITKDISFHFAASFAGDGYIFKGDFRINRRDFNVGGTSTISNELEVQLNIAAKKP